MEPKKKSVKVKSIHVTDYKGISELAAIVNGNHFITFGRNGAGKSTIKEIIDNASKRIDPKDIAALPIKIGAKNAKVGIIYHIDEEGKEREILVETIYRPSGAVMKVIDLANDGELKPPVEKLMQIIGESHDLSVLMDMTPEEQFKKIFDILGGSLASTNFEEEYEKLEDERKDKNKEIKNGNVLLESIKPSLEVLTDNRTKGEYEKAKPYAPDYYERKPDKAKLVQEKSDIEKYNLQRTNALDGVDKLKEEIKELEKQILLKTERLNAGNKWLKENPEKKTDEVDAKILAIDEDIKTWEQEKIDIDEYNKKVNSISDYKAQEEKIKTATKDKEEIQSKMDAVKKKMQDSVASLPLSEIAPNLRLLNEVIEEEGKKPRVNKGMYYVEIDAYGKEHLLPFNKRQISYGKMIVELAKLSSVVNYGKLNYFSIPSWNELDESSQKEILKFAEENADLNLQYIIEEVKNEVLGIKVIEKFS